ncbi:Hypothetical predicted protein [Octopus vulgaris]|uniref:Uncharacterized protein n=1 Tax=Octopus vulgaris TaxID=6645 RepID=A0AA36BBX1_OCTVU|nr:Hypothetical predicted protein [Octopus vulgaris]
MATRCVLDYTFYRLSSTADAVIVVADEVGLCLFLPTRDVYAVAVVAGVKQGGSMKPLEPHDGAELTKQHALLAACKHVYRVLDSTLSSQNVHQ